MRRFSTAVKDLVIIGSGPAGYTAAVYAARANLRPVLFEGYEVGGQLTTTSTVENYPGFADGIMGPQLMESMRKQAEHFGTEFRTTDVTKVDLSTRPFRVTASDDDGITEARSLIIASGAGARLLGLPAEKKLLGYGVSTCATCDGSFFRDMRVIVVGGGDSALEEALFLTKFASKVTVVHRGDALRASKIMQDRARENPKIAFLWRSVIDDIYDVEARTVKGVKVRNVHTNAVVDFQCEGVFVAIGHTPNTKIVKGQLQLDELGYIITKPGTSVTSVDGVFAAGDVQDRRYRQAITAAGSGCMAAMDVEHYLAAHSAKL